MKFHLHFNNSPKAFYFIVSIATILEDCSLIVRLFEQLLRYAIMSIMFLVVWRRCWELLVVVIVLAPELAVYEADWRDALPFVAVVFVLVAFAVDCVAMHSNRPFAREQQLVAAAVDSCLHAYVDYALMCDFAAMVLLDAMLAYVVHLPVHLDKLDWNSIEQADVFVVAAVVAVVDGLGIPVAAALDILAAVAYVPVVNVDNAFVVLHAVGYRHLDRRFEHELDNNLEAYSDVVVAGIFYR